MRVRAGGGHGQSCSLRFILGACWHGVWAHEHVSISATELALNPNLISGISLAMSALAGCGLQ